VLPISSSFVCEVCGARVATVPPRPLLDLLRPLGGSAPRRSGASCAICFDRRHENLRMMEFRGSWIPICYNCAGKTQQLMPVPKTVDGVRQQLSRDRRWHERRQGKKDNRIFAIERRSKQRRGPPLRDDDDCWTPRT